MQIGNSDNMLINILVGICWPWGVCACSFTYTSIRDIWCYHRL